ncbi:MAG: PQQ-dependent sugar dehydrogenase [Planctomycetes bacterium]|nr:PQQ-dependent sugar dehydrogenase [Planctomycetota bacterium]
MPTAALSVPFASAVLVLASAALAQTVPAGFVVDTLPAAGLSTPNDCCFLPDGRCLIANSGGSVVVFAGATSATIGSVPNVESGGERGLLSIAADPGFATNGQFYVYYSSTADNFMHLDRFTCTGDLALAGSTNLQFAAASRHVLLGALPDNAGNHNGGSVRFGPDGMLYLTVGDDAVACNAQLLTSQVGCLLRLDVSGRPAGGSTVLPSFDQLDPGTNPLSANTDFRQLLLGHGLRNPFRMEIDPLTGSLYIGDVGAGAVEEYSEYVYPSSGPLPLVNFGWPWREGAQAGFSCTGTQPPGLVDPIAGVTHSAGWASVMGGARYRNLGGTFDFGLAYEGNTFFLDYFAGQVRRLVEAGGVWSPAPPVPGQPNATDWGTGFDSVTSLRLGPDGALWFTQHPSSLKRVRLLGPVPSIAAVSGGGEIVTVGEPFAQPLVVRVLDAQGNPQPNGSVTFAVSGGGTLSTTNPVIADANGLAQTTVTATSVGGAITVTAATPGAIQTASFTLFARRLRVIHASNLVIVTLTNTSPNLPVQVPLLLMMSVPGIPALPTVLGPVCTDPFHPFTLVLEDSIGLFGSELGGAGLVGAPSVTKIYTVPAGLLTGLNLTFQAVGIDPTLGWFLTNCEPHQF